MGPEIPEMWDEVGSRAKATRSADSSLKRGHLYKSILQVPKFFERVKGLPDVVLQLFFDRE